MVQSFKIAFLEEMRRYYFSSDHELTDPYGISVFFVSFFGHVLSAPLVSSNSFLYDGRNLWSYYIMALSSASVDRLVSAR